MAKEASKKIRRPTAAKREIQNEKKFLRNRMFKSSVRTAKRHFESALSAGDNTEIHKRLSLLYSLMDKGVKKGVFTQGTADRKKSRLTRQAAG